MRILDLTADRSDLLDAAAGLLHSAFEGRSHAWPDLQSARQEVAESLTDGRISRVAIDEGGTRRHSDLKGHPYEFYLRLGFTIVGVMPDANGPGKPDIFFAKRIQSSMIDDR